MGAQIGQHFVVIRQTQGQPENLNQKEVKKRLLIVMGHTKGRV